MNLNSNINKNDLFSQLLELDVDVMMDKIHDILLVSGGDLLSKDNPREDVIDGLNQLIKWFEYNEKYEQCNTIKKIINECLE
tara:strand:+ start:1678 stop:1923 length:246 start_codon:yes stop_codon:yes gene_type:complete